MRNTRKSEWSPFVGCLPLLVYSSFSCVVQGRGFYEALESVLIPSPPPQKMYVISNKVYIVENTTCSGEKRTLYQMYGIANVRYFEVYFTKIKKEIRPWIWKMYAIEECTLYQGYVISRFHCSFLRHLCPSPPLRSHQNNGLQKTHSHRPISELGFQPPSGPQEVSSKDSTQ